MIAKTVAERILELVILLREEVAEIKQMIGEDGMEPLDRRLKRVETKTHALADGTFGKDDGMDRKL